MFGHLNMKRGGGGGRGGAPKIFRHPKGGSEKIRAGGFENLYTFTPKRRRAPKKTEPLARGLLKFQASSFNIFIPPPPPLVILNELSLTRQMFNNTI